MGGGGGGFNTQNFTRFTSFYLVLPHSTLPQCLNPNNRILFIPNYNNQMLYCSIVTL